jgi:hypothetical protein
MAASETVARIGPDLPKLRLRLAAAADWGRENLRLRLAAAADQKIAQTRSPCARDLNWYLIQLAESEIEDERLPREVKTAEALWRAAMEVERLDAWGEG